MYYSESSFYLSFYYDIVSAPTWKDVFRDLLEDSKIEFPETVVRLRRVNIFQEIILGILWRLLDLEKFFEKPFNFYAYSTLLFHSFGVAILFTLASDIGNSIIPGIFFLGLYLSNFQGKLISRIIALPLRENFATPALWLSIFSLRKILDGNEVESKNSRKWYCVLFFAYLWLMLSWQLSLQLVATQLLSLFALNVLGIVSDQKITRILRTGFYAFISSSSLMLFPLYSIASILTNVMISMCVTIWFFSGDCRRKSGRFKTLVHKVLLFSIVFVTFHILNNATSRPDSHIIDIFLVKLGLSEHTFDSMIYQLGSEFRVIPMHILKMIAGTNLFYYLAISVFVMLFDCFRKCYKNPYPEMSFTLYFTFQTVIFTCLMVMMSRLRILALPLLCVFATFIFEIGSIENINKMFCIKLLMLSVALSPFYFTMPLDELKVPPFGELYNSRESKELIQWINTKIDPEASILSDMPTSSIIRSCTRNKIVINPQYEYYPLRQKTKFLYVLGDCADEEWFGRKLLEWYKTELVVVPSKFCTIFGRGIESPNSIHRLLRLNPFSTCEKDTPFHERLCNKILVGQNSFELLFSNASYFVFKYKKDESINTPKIHNWSLINSLETFKPWLNNHCAGDNETGPFQIYSTFVFLGRYFRSEASKPLLDYGLELFPNNPTMIELYAEALDYDLGDYTAAKSTYERVMEMNGGKCETVDDFVLISKYLELLMDTEVGSVEDIVKLIETSEGCLHAKYERNYAKSLCLFSVKIFKLFKRYKVFQNTQIKSVATSFWRLAEKVGRQNGCYEENYSLFNSGSINSLDVIVSFLRD